MALNLKDFSSALDDLATTQRIDWVLKALHHTANINRKTNRTRPDPLTRIFHATGNRRTAPSM